MNTQQPVDLTPIFLPVFKLLIPILATVGLIAYLKEWILRQSKMSDIDKMSGREFECFLQLHFKEKGYKVQLTPYKGDYGADIVLTMGEERVAVQAKRHKGRIGIRAIQEVVASIAKYNCHRCMVITNSEFTKAARDLARANKVELWDRDRLQREISTKIA